MCVRVGYEGNSSLYQHFSNITIINKSCNDF